jgi:hypothetical protein
VKQVCAVIGCGARSDLGIVAGWGLLLENGRRHCLCPKHEAGPARLVLAKGQTPFLCDCGAVIDEDVFAARSHGCAAEAFTDGALIPVRVAAAIDQAVEAGKARRDGAAGVAVPVTAIEVGVEDRLAAMLDRVLEAEPTPDELSVLELVVERMFGKGRAVYGPLREALDERDFEHEALEEHVDGSIYSAIAAIRRKRIRSAQ